ncbi:MAG: ferritin-like domain-containing protein [Thermoleophilaceae bacterium]|nr:ferritin-like domain-containing protein [Thermoleophilaceae bacterium]
MLEPRTNLPNRDGEPAMEQLARDPSSRKRFLSAVGGAGAATVFAGLLAACGQNGGGEGERVGDTGSVGAGSGGPTGGAAATRQKNPDPKMGTSDLEILNYALSLEYLENAFYARVLESDLFTGSDLEMIKGFAQNEREHLEAIKATVQKMGGEPAAEPKTKFPLGKPTSVLTLAATLENAGAAAYLGQANRIRSKEVLAAALSIHTVEARHAAALNALLGLAPEPEGAFAVPAPMEEVLASVQQFIVTPTP